MNMVHVRNFDLGVHYSCCFTFLCRTKDIESLEKNLKCQVDSIVPDATKSNTTVSSHVMLFLGLEIQMLEEIKSFGATTHCFRKWQNTAVTEQTCKKSSAEGKNGPSSSNEHHPRMLPYICIYIYVFTYIYIYMYLRTYIYIYGHPPNIYLYHFLMVFTV